MALNNCVVEVWDTNKLYALFEQNNTKFNDLILQLVLYFIMISILAFCLTVFFCICAFESDMTFQNDALTIPSLMLLRGSLGKSVTLAS